MRYRKTAAFIILAAFVAGGIGIRHVGEHAAVSSLPSVADKTVVRYVAKRADSGDEEASKVLNQWLDSEGKRQPAKEYFMQVVPLAASYALFALLLFLRCVPALRCQQTERKTYHGGTENPKQPADA